MRVDISGNELIDRLRIVQSKLTEQNEHSDAIFVGFAIQLLDERRSIQAANEMYPLHSFTPNTLRDV